VFKEVGVGAVARARESTRDRSQRAPAAARP
jgi:hypothetical protein